MATCPVKVFVSIEKSCVILSWFRAHESSTSLSLGVVEVVQCVGAYGGGGASLEVAVDHCG